MALLGDMERLRRDLDKHESTHRPVRVVVMIYSDAPLPDPIISNNVHTTFTRYEDIKNGTTR
jgi:hypothetical protein